MSAVEVATRVTVDEVKERLDRGEPLVLVDARNAEAWASSDVRLPGALRLRPGEVSAHIEEIPRDRSIITYCT